MRAWLRQQFQTGVLGTVDVLLMAGLVLTLGGLLVVNLGRGGEDDVPSGGDYVSQPPAGAPAVGRFSRTRVGADGVMRVQQWIRSDRPLRSITLRTPPDISAARATELTVAADQVVVPGRRTVTSGGLRIALPAPTSVVYLTYALHGVVEQSPSSPGRALARATALRVSYRPVSGPSQVEVTAPKVLTAACSGSGSSVPAPCGTPVGGHGWRVVLQGAQRESSVMAQLDLG